MRVENQFETPVLLMIYNRPDTTRRVFAEIRKLRPSKLYIAADGPKNVQGDRDKCEATRAVVETIDWDCDVRLRFSEENIGCGLGVATATGWFFEHEPEGIVLEDDTVPHQSFFWFCRELLAKYRHDERIMLIGGNNFQGGIIRGDGSYFFGKYPMMWGWAGWRRTWQKFDFKMRAFPQFRDRQLIKNVFEQIPVQQYWLDIFERTYQGRIDCWDYQMVFAIWVNGGLCITPNVNLVSNIGCGHPDATHTTISDDPLANVPTSPMEEVIHPAFIMRDLEADKHDSRHVFSINTGNDFQEN